MRIWTIFAAAVAATICATAASAAPPAAGGLRVCDPTPIAGKTWLIAARGLSCAEATSVVRTMAAQHPANRLYHGTYHGLACLGGTRGGMQGVTCVSRTADKQIQAGVRGR